MGFGPFFPFPTFFKLRNGASPWRAVTDVQLLEALRRRRLRLPPAPSHPFTVHDVSLYVYNLSSHHPSKLYDEYGGGAAGCVYLFADQLTNKDHEGWKVAGGTQRVPDAGGSEVGRKNTLVFHEGRWLRRARWAMDEFNYTKHDEESWLACDMVDLRLYRLRRLDDA
ncbi:hypothetical protein BS78_05G169000 [Paspalum vaginatum]|nr:hypothetical protein BS78_05G169000 [Paspalum vaginatum]